MLFFVLLNKTYIYYKMKLLPIALSALSIFGVFGVHLESYSEDYSSSSESESVNGA